MTLYSFLNLCQVPFLSLPFSVSLTVFSVLILRSIANLPFNHYVPIILLLKRKSIGKMKNFQVFASSVARAEEKSPYPTVAPISFTVVLVEGMYFPNRLPDLLKTCFVPLDSVITYPIVAPALSRSNVFMIRIQTPPVGGGVISI